MIFIIKIALGVILGIVVFNLLANEETRGCGCFALLVLVVAIAYVSC